MNEPTHILMKAGVLASFSISKRLTEREVNTMTQSAIRKGKSDDEIVDIVKTKIMEEILDASEKGTLPGIILDPQTQFISIKDVKKINQMVVLFTKEIKSKRLNKTSLCYFINYLVGNLGLTEDDFEEFYRKLREIQGEDGDDKE